MNYQAYSDEIAARDLSAQDAYDEALEKALNCGQSQVYAYHLAEQAAARVYECWEIDRRDFEE